jgi:hypothetical protein
VLHFWRACTVAAAAAADRGAVLPCQQEASCRAAATALQSISNHLTQSISSLDTRYGASCTSCAVVAHGPLPRQLSRLACTHERLIAWWALTLIACLMHAAMSESLAPWPPPKTLQLQSSREGYDRPNYWVAALRAAQVIDACTASCIWAEILLPHRSCYWMHDLQTICSVAVCQHQIRATEVSSKA